MEIEATSEAGASVSFEEIRRWYFFATDAYNVLDRMLKRELRWVHEGKRVVLLIDCYDLIPYLFDQDVVFHEDHYEYTRGLWTEVFDALRPGDPLSICLSAPSALELFHFLDKKAEFVLHGVLPFGSEDAKRLDRLQSTLAKYRAAEYGLSLTDALIDPNSETIPQLGRLKELIRSGVVVGEERFFGNSPPGRKELNRVVGPIFNGDGAAKYLRKERHDYLAREKGEFTPDAKSLGLDTFSVNIDITNIEQTIYMDSTSKDELFTFTSHGMYLILCCHPSRGFWNPADGSSAPVANSLLALFLVKSLRMYSDSYDDAEQFFSLMRGVLRVYLGELSRTIKSIGQLEAYIRNPRANSALAGKLITADRDLIQAESYFVDRCLGQITGLRPKMVRIGLTGVPRESGSVMTFANDFEGRKNAHDEIAARAARSVTEMELLQPDQIVKTYEAPDERTTELLLKLEGYSLDDWAPQQLSEE